MAYEGAGVSLNYSIGSPPRNPFPGPPTPSTATTVPTSPNGTFLVSSWQQLAAAASSLQLSVEIALQQHLTLPAGLGAVSVSGPNRTVRVASGACGSPYGAFAFPRGTCVLDARGLGRHFKVSRHTIQSRRGQESPPRPFRAVTHSAAQRATTARGLPQPIQALLRTHIRPTPPLFFTQVERGATLTLDGIALVNGNAPLGGSALAVSGGALVARGAFFEGSESLTAGGALAAVGPGASIQIAHGASSSSISTVFFSHSPPFETTARRKKALHTASHPDTTHIPCSPVRHHRSVTPPCAGSFANCTAHRGGGGGAAALDGAELRLLSSRFSRCSALGGGAVSVTQGSLLSADDVAFEDCSAEGYGGAAEVLFSSRASLLRARFLRASSGFDGGALLAWKRSVVDIADSLFSGCTASYGSNGAGVAAELQCALTLRNTTFERTAAAGTGGSALFGFISNLTVLGSTFRENSLPPDAPAGAGGAGGGGGAITVQGLQGFSNEYCSGEPWCSEAALRVEGSFFYNNSFTGADGHLHAGGGAIGSVASGETSLTVTDSLFVGNTAPGGRGGAISATGFKPLALTGSTFIENEADGCGAVSALDFVSVDLTGTAFRRNTAASGAGGGACVGQRPPETHNCAPGGQEQLLLGSKGAWPHGGGAEEGSTDGAPVPGGLALRCAGVGPSLTAVSPHLSRFSPLAHPQGCFGFSSQRRCVSAHTAHAPAAAANPAFSCFAAPPVP